MPAYTALQMKHVLIEIYSSTRGIFSLLLPFNAHHSAEEKK